ncbi:MAG TPA: tetratricopeptide repeat protein [Bryobacteraceae bacterium]|nr:tetratricopeptide repeat protein [Bryobacteraceae bacterium]
MISKSARFWFSIYAFTAIILTIAVGVFAWLASESRKEAGEGRTANARPPVLRHIPEERYRLLAHFDPPLYSPAETNSSKGRAFQRAMERYTKGDYAGAIAGLRTAAAAQPDPPAARFYLGICFLLTNQNPSGIHELSAVAAAASAHQERARFYLAKAYLGQLDPTAAREQLQAVIAMHGELEKQAQALLAQIQ